MAIQQLSIMFEGSKQAFLEKNSCPFIRLSPGENVGKEAGTGGIIFPNKNLSKISFYRY
jgi:hypothetical protein